MEEQENKKSFRWKPYALFTMFFILPGLSWYYLQQGANFQMAARSELKDYGKIRSVAQIDDKGQKHNLIENKITVIHFFQPNGAEYGPQDQEVIDLYAKLHSQFKDRAKDFAMVMVTDKPSAELRNAVFHKGYADNPNWVFSQATSSWGSILSNGYEYYLLETKARQKESYVALADAKGNIRNFYDPSDEGEVLRLVKHIALLLTI